MRHFTSLESTFVTFMSIATCIASSIPRTFTREIAQFFPHYNSQRVKIRYGPYTTDAISVNNGMANFVQQNATMPCTDCTIIFVQAGLEYDDGTTADADTQFWLHHTVIYNQNKLPAVCSLPGHVDKLFASGNERTPVSICANGKYEAGYYLGPSDSIGISTELMNMADVPQTAYVTVTWEYISRPPPSFSDVKVLWLDIAGCNGSSEQPPKSSTHAFEYDSPAWVGDMRGEITFIGGHLHDGGTHLNVKRNGINQCDSVATYGGLSFQNGDNAAKSHKAHISNISVCDNIDHTVVAPGDIWSISAHYDPAKHDLMLNADGSPEPIMGIALVYVADRQTAVRTPDKSPALKDRSSLWPLAVLLIAVSGLTYTCRLRRKEIPEITFNGYKLVQPEEA